MASTSDRWAKWILERRFGGDQQRTQMMLEWLGPVRDQILDHASIKPGERLLDVGCGDGLVGFEALARETGCRVVFSDVSESLVDQCRQLADRAGVADRCAFVVAPAEDLGELGDSSVDVVTTRSVLIYVKDKAQALREFHRVLRPGGRISIFEPINRYFVAADGSLPQAWDPGPVKDLADKVLAVFMRANPMATSPMMDFDERDLVSLAERAGFQEVHLRLHVDIEPTKPLSWEGFYRSSPNPLAPTLEEAANEVLTPEEVDRYVRHFRPLVESGVGTARQAQAYLWARRSS
jgi:ubiquinone/menaquinone biosynthesis C-methylase UbiE